MKELPDLTEILRDTFQTLIDQFVQFVPRLLGGLVILVIGVLVARLIEFIVRRVLQRIGFDKIGARLNEISIIKQLKTTTF